MRVRASCLQQRQHHSVSLVKEHETAMHLCARSIDHKRPQNSANRTCCAQFHIFLRTMPWPHLDTFRRLIEAPDLHEASVLIIGHSMVLHSALEAPAKGNGMKHRAIRMHRRHGIIVLVNLLDGVVDI